MKMIALGIAFANRSYLRDPWNWLDLIIVGTIIFFFMINSEYNWTVLRILRILPILRKQEEFPKLQFLASTILRSLVQILFVILVLLIFIFIFAIIGKATFSGVTHKRCVQNFINGTYFLASDRICGGSYSCPDDSKCETVSEDYYYINNTYEDFSNFDNMGTSILAIFQVSSLEGWDKAMLTMEDGYSRWFSTIFYILCAVVCGCFTMSLALPVLRDYYFRCVEKAAAEEYKDLVINKKLVFFILLSQLLIFIGKSCENNAKDKEI